MLQHNVYFWLRENLRDEEREHFRAAVNSLLNIAGIDHGAVGTPIPSERAVVDDTFDVSLHLTFQDTAAHDQYQVDPAHAAFVADNRATWTRVLVYDSEIA